MARRVDDHSSWVGAGSKGSVFPDGVKVKMTGSEEGAGDIANYPDTDEMIKRDQKMNVSKMKSSKPKEGYRN